MNDETPIAEESAGPVEGGGVEFEIGGLEGGEGDVAVLAGQVADLAFFGLGGVAGGRFAAFGGVEVGEGAAAVAGAGHGLRVDVVDWRARNFVVSQSLHYHNTTPLDDPPDSGMEVGEGARLTEWPQRLGRESVQVDVEHDTGPVGI